MPRIESDQRIVDSPVLLRVFLSSPGDVSEERQRAREVLQRLSEQPALRGRIKFEIVGWEKTLVPLSASLSPQEAINRGIYSPAECDVVIVILWSRMGTPLPDDYRRPDGHRYMSGVEWEYENAYTASPQPEILVFRKSGVPSISLADLYADEKIRQYKLVEQFFRRFQTEDGRIIAGYNSFESTAEFESELTHALTEIAWRRFDEVAKVQSATRTEIVRPTTDSRRSVFISYAHADEYWLERLKIHLRPLERDNDMEYWDDTKIRPGSIWLEEIKSAIEKARVAVLLISADFLASEFIVNDELPPLLAAAANEGAVILPVVISPCRFMKTTSLSRFQSINPPLKPLIGLSRAESEAMLVKVTDAIEEAIIA